MARKKFVGDLLALGLFLLGISLFLFFLTQDGIIKLFGLSGSVIVLITEAVFLWQTWIK